MASYDNITDNDYVNIHADDECVVEPEYDYVDIHDDDECVVESEYEINPVIMEKICTHKSKVGIYGYFKMEKPGDIDLFVRQIDRLLHKQTDKFLVCMIFNESEIYLFIIPKKATHFYKKDIVKDYMLKCRIKLFGIVYTHPCTEKLIKLTDDYSLIKHKGILEVNNILDYQLKRIDADRDRVYIVGTNDTDVVSYITTLQNPAIISVEYGMSHPENATYGI